MTGLVGVLVGLAVAFARPSGRRLPGAARLARPARTPRSTGPPRDFSSILLGAAAQLRAGASPAEAWARALGDPAVGAVPSVGAVLRATGRRRPGAGDAQRARVVVAAARLSDDLGAPLAGVVERIAAAVAADEEAEGERRAALAGPRATARVLAWLPVLGLLLGVALGADPVGVVVSGGLGTAAAVLGLALLLLGRWWTSALLARAARR
ncbi:type II secretion protein F [Cellulomonas sp. ICMP 17802]|uniref:type II secretion protein F n=1 Tax=Cellulomonas sp. ICMP 17802 TaxID=3239199 RepID=UPI00351BC66D